MRDVKTLASLMSSTTWQHARTHGIGKFRIYGRARNHVLSLCTIRSSFSAHFFKKEGATRNTVQCVFLTGHWICDPNSVIVNQAKNRDEINKKVWG